MILQGSSASHGWIEHCRALATRQMVLTARSAHQIGRWQPQFEEGAASLVVACGDTLHM